MAEGKKSFVLYADYINIFEELTDEEAGQLAKHMFRYVNDQHPEAENRLIKIAFEPIKQQLKRDLKEWEETIEKRREAGRISAERRQQKQVDSTHANTCQQVTTVNDTVTVTVNVTDTVLSKDNEVIPPPTQKPKLKNQPEALQFPFTGPEFLEAWNKLITLPKWKKKPLSAIQTSLNQLSRYDEEFSVKLIEKAHAGNYQGVVFDDTDEKFLKWKNQRNGQTFNANAKSKIAGTYQAAAELAREIEREN
jgi:hypothetical protein